MNQSTKTEGERERISGAGRRKVEFSSVVFFSDQQSKQRDKQSIMGRSIAECCKLAGWTGAETPHTLPGKDNDDQQAQADELLMCAIIINSDNCDRQKVKALREERGDHE